MFIATNHHVLIVISLVGVVAISLDEEVIDRVKVGLAHLRKTANTPVLSLSCSSSGSNGGLSLCMFAPEFTKALLAPGLDSLTDERVV